MDDILASDTDLKNTISIWIARGFKYSNAVDLLIPKMKVHFPTRELFDLNLKSIKHFCISCMPLEQKSIVEQNDLFGKTNAKFLSSHEKDIRFQATKIKQQITYLVNKLRDDMFGANMDIFRERFKPTASIDGVVVYNSNCDIDCVAVDCGDDGDDTLSDATELLTVSSGIKSIESPIGKKSSPTRSKKSSLIIDKQLDGQIGDSIFHYQTRYTLNDSHNQIKFMEIDQKKYALGYLCDNSSRPMFLFDVDNGFVYDLNDSTMHYEADRELKVFKSIDSDIDGDEHNDTDAVSKIN